MKSSPKILEIFSKHQRYSRGISLWELSPLSDPVTFLESEYKKLNTVERKEFERILNARLIDPKLTRENTSKYFEQLLYVSSHFKKMPMNIYKLVNRSEDHLILMVSVAVMRGFVKFKMRADSVELSEMIVWLFKKMLNGRPSDRKKNVISALFSERKIITAIQKTALSQAV